MTTVDIRSLTGSTWSRSQALSCMKNARDEKLGGSLRLRLGCTRFCSTSNLRC